VRALAVVRCAVAGMLGRADFRVVHFSVQGNHLHLVVEARDDRALSEGIQGVSVRLAKGLNRMMGRRGRVFSDRYHAHVLRTPLEVRRALAYVLQNHRSHMARIGERASCGVIDPFSSAASFDGWAGSAAPAAAPDVTSEPRTWLLASGWKRHGRLSPADVPARHG
jgi:hypothetical protein